MVDDRTHDSRVDRCFLVSSVGAMGGNMLHATPSEPFMSRNFVGTTLEETREEATRARARADDALAELNDRAGRVYQGFQSQWSTLLEASSIADFSDRIEFMGQLAQADADLATTASKEQREALWLADELEKTVEERRSILQDIERKQAEIRSLIDQAQETYEELGRKYRDALAAERAAAAAAAEAQAGSDITTGVTPGPVPVVSGS